MLHTKPSIIKLNTVGPANFSSHRLISENGILRLIPRLRSYFGEYFMLAGLAGMAIMFLNFYAKEQIETKPLAIILGILLLVALLLKWLFKRSYAHIIFDKHQDKIYNTHTLSTVKLSDITGLEIVSRNIWGGLNDEHSGSYRAFGILLCSQDGQLYSVVCNAVYRDIETIANDIAKFLGVDVKDS